MPRGRKFTPQNRGGIWYIDRRVPKRFAELDRRGIVHLSTGIRVADDPRAIRARNCAPALVDNLEAYWRGLEDGQSAEARRRYDAAQSRARDMGLVYASNTELAAGDIGDLLRRYQLLVDTKAVDDSLSVAGALGGEDKPALKLSDLVAEYEAINAVELTAYSIDQRKRWRNPKLRAVANLIGVIGDKALADLKRGDALAFRKFWQERIAAEDLAIGTANKDFGHVSKMLTAIDVNYQLGLPPVFLKLRFSGEESEQRLAFSPKWVRDEILAPGAFDGLNAEAVAIVMIIVETGARPSEICNAVPANIRLKEKVPYIHIAGAGRVLKTRHSVRDIPLVGVALDAFRRFPNGFERYRDKGATLSATVNKYMRENGLLETPEHTLYGLRHTFEDRLTAIETPEKIVAMLMGHKWHRPKYGSGPTLEHTAKWLKKIAFKPPRA